jgi:hypothetical protein
VSDPGGPEDALTMAATALAGPDGHELATIWATVDLERALENVDGGRDPDAKGEGTADVLLGARIVLVPARDGGPTLALAEPTTEGRLAATLARHGEGPAGRYVAVPDGLVEARSRAAAAGLAVSRVEAGPFGPSMLVLVGSVSGPHLILCESAAVPSAP